MIKIIGVTCDNYKTEKFRKRLIERGFKIVFEGNLKKATNVHIFKIEVDEDYFLEEKERLQKVLKELEIELKQSN